MNLASYAFILQLTCSNTLQFRSHPDALQVRLRIRTANFCKFGVEDPYDLHHSAVDIDS